MITFLGLHDCASHGGNYCGDGTATDMFGFLGIYLSILVIGFVWPAIWRFIDDGDSRKYNPVITFLARLNGLKRRSGGGVYNFYDSNHIYGTDIPCSVLWLGSFAFFLPLLINLFIWQPVIPIVMCLVIGLMFTARFARRTQKKLVKHMITLNAHTKANVEREDD